MSLKQKISSLTVLRRQYLEKILVSLAARPHLMMIFNLFLIAASKLMAILKKISGRLPRPTEPEPAMNPIVPLHEPRWVPKRLNVLLIVEESIPHCFRYRVQQKIEQLKIAGHSAKWISWKDGASARQEIHFCHVVIFYRVPAFDEVVHTIDLAKALNKVVFYDIDDLIFDKEIMEEKIKHFSSGISKKECTDLVVGAKLYRRAIGMCPYTIGSTPALCEELTHLSRKSYLHRNALDSRSLEYLNNRPPRVERDPITILYGSGTKTHDVDFDVVTSSLVRILKRFSEVRLTILGFLNLPKEFDAYLDRIDRIDILCPESYWEILGSADINIAPLQTDRFSDCKSEIKWLEAAILKVPSVVSDTRTYREVISDGEDGYIASISEEWQEKIASLVVDLPLRQLMGENAYASARAAYKPESSAQNMGKIIRDALALENKRGVVRSISRRKRIAYVNVLYPPQALGGATVIVKNHIDALRALYGSEFEIAVFTTNGTSGSPYDLTEYEYEGVHVTSVDVPPGIDLDWRYQDAYIHELFKRYLHFQRPDLIHFHCVQRLTASTLEAAQQCNIPYFVTLHDSWWLCDRQFMLNNHGRDCEQTRVDPLICSGCVEDADGSLMRRSYLAKQLEKAHLLLAVSRYQKELYESNGFKNVVLNCNGVIKPDHMQLKRHNRKVKMGYIGGVCVHKGYYFLREIVKSSNLRQSEIMVVDFHLRPGIHREETWGSTPVQFIPKVPFAEMGSFYSALDVLIVPSIWRESFGLVTREAIMNGVWVVAAEAGGLAEDIREGVDGHTFRKGNKEGLSDILKKIDTNPSFYHEKRNPDTSHIRSIEEQVEELVPLYNNVLNMAGASPLRSPQKIFQPNMMDKS